MTLISRRIALVRKLEPYYADLAKQNMKPGRGGNISTPLGKVRDVLGKKADVSGRTYEKGIKILEIKNHGADSAPLLGKLFCKYTFYEFNISLCLILVTVIMLHLVYAKILVK